MCMILGMLSRIEMTFFNRDQYLYCDLVLWNPPAFDPLADPARPFSLIKASFSPSVTSMKT